MSDDSRELTLYVQSKKVVTSFYRAPAANVPPAGMAVSGAPSDLGEGSAAGESAVYFLSDDQSRCAALTEEVASHRGTACA